MEILAIIGTVLVIGVLGLGMLILKGYGWIENIIEKQREEDEK